MDKARTCGVHFSAPLCGEEFGKDRRFFKKGVEGPDS